MIDLAIIGAGPAGYVAAERAAARGVNVVVFEKKELGGVCLNEGCVPTKTLLYSAKILDYAKSADKYGVKIEGIDFDFKRIYSRKNKVVRKLTLGIAAKMKEHNVEVVKGDAQIKGRSADGVEIECNGENYKATNLLICTGSEAFVPPIKGVEEAGEIVVTNREILQLTEQPERLVIIGGGVIGMEFASLFNSLGTEVTVVEMLPEILGGLDEEISAMLREVYAKKGIKFNLLCRVTEIDGGRVIFTTPEGEMESVEGDKILVSVGRRAVVSGFGLENLGVEVVKGGIKVDEKMCTNVPNVYAAGDVTGFSLLAHTASREGEVVVNNLTGKTDTMSYDAIPGIVYTNPEVAGVGLTERVAAEQGIEYKVAKLPMSYSGRFVAENEGGSGLCKVLIDAKSEKILGVHMLGNPCSEMIFGACSAIEQGLTIHEWERVVFPHPTVSEIIKETIMTF